MTYATGTMRGSEQFGYAWILPAAFSCSTKAGRYFIALMKRAAARERTRKELADLDLHMLQDIGLEPFDVYDGWRGTLR